MRDDRLFNQPTAAWAARGAAIGVALVMAAFIIAIALSDLGMDLLGVAAAAAVFGGVGMGAMLGATLAQFHQPQPAVAQTTEPRRAHDPPAV